MMALVGQQQQQLPGRPDGLLAKPEHFHFEVTNV
jgi:hypothetical protein